MAAQRRRDELAETRSHGAICYRAMLQKLLYRDGRGQIMELRETAPCADGLTSDLLASMKTLQFYGALSETSAVSQREKH